MSESMNNFHGSIVPQMTDENRNSVFSAYSIYSVLAMTSAGANGKTLDEFKKVLFVGERNIHEEMKKMHQIMKRSRRQISIAEAIFTQAEILEEFRENSVSNYEAEITTTKFPQPGENEVNKYVEKKTKGMIKDIVKDKLDSNTRMVLINAIYFKAKWKVQFKKNQTKRNQIFKSHGKEIRVDYMFRGNSKEMYSKTKINGCGFVSCSLPYVGNAFSMLFIKPLKAGPVALSKVLRQVVSSDPNFVGKVISTQRAIKLKRLMIPKFKIESNYELKKVLVNLGLVAGFSDTLADFSRMADPKKNPRDDLMIDDVIHKAKIIVDESGTEAAAATAVIMRTKSCARRPKEKVTEFVLDRPFCCFIIHNRTKSVIFSTNVVTPRYD